ncbi:hypothetical protein MFIFM68171_04908 [Madurella fahalii]|uniref:Secondary metabolism regulator LAE1 n=1 Tax=Madurella fahalii TaxID=1157608 RepID=A0ABQ0GAA5_9PEZI
MPTRDSSTQREDHSDSYPPPYRPATSASPAAASPASPGTAADNAQQAIAADPRLEGGPDSTIGDDEVTVHGLDQLVNFGVPKAPRKNISQLRGRRVLGNDNMQLEGQDINHHMLYLALEDKLFLAPLENPQKVLDVGTGTGNWAIDFADEYPSAEVVWVDLAPNQPTWVPPNCKFELDDLS